MKTAPAQQVECVYLLAVCHNDVAADKTYVPPCYASCINKKWMW